MGSNNYFNCESGFDVWSEEDVPQTVQCRPSNWSSILMEELMETNVIGNQDMSVLKQQSNSGVTSDPALLSDLRHNKDVRSALHFDRSQPSRSGIMMEARRILSKEEKAKKILHIQNKIVDNEVDKFQNHITNLRKMNQRLERIAFPIHNGLKKRKDKLHHQFELSPLYQQNGNCGRKPMKKMDDLKSHEQEKPKNFKGSQNWNMEDESSENHNSYKGSFLSDGPSGRKEKTTLSISGHKMDEHEIIKHSPMSSSLFSSESQNTVFERIHQRYAESERDRVSKEGTSCIRHSSPVDESERTDSQHAAIISSNEIHFAENSYVHQAKWVDSIGPQAEMKTAVTQRTEVSIGEWSLPKTTSKKVCDIKKDGSDKPLPSPGTMAPPISLKRADKNKLESMSRMYAKWMENACVFSDTKLEGYNTLKIREEKGKEENSTKQPSKTLLSREEKIMQVLQALQKQKDNKATAAYEKDQARSTRFSKSVNDIREDKANHEGHKFRRAISGTYEHRLKAHKDVISQQKAKLDKQKRQIEDLKLSQLRMESEKSKLETQKTVSEVLESCDPRVKAQAKFLKSSLSLADLSPDNSFVLRMEQRALEQRQKKLLAQERRKQFDEKWKKKVKEAEEKKRLEEEALIRKKHEEAKEMRRKERELREEARKEREKMIDLERKADTFLQQRRLKRGLLAFKKLVTLKKAQEDRAIVFYKEHLMHSFLKVWKREVENRLKARMACADNFYYSNLLQHCFDALKEALVEGAKYMQVAEDMHDFHLQERCFHAWLKHTQAEQEITAKKMEKADEHFHKVILQRYLCIWRRYPEVAQQEREKERRKMVWRNKVQQLLPDFRPLLTSD